MTAIKPTESLRVRAVPSERYPINRKCAQPECTEGAVDPHHIFPRSMIAGDSWFVEITDSDGQIGLPIPHVTGLCRAHHDDVEQHRAWIRLHDNAFEWWDINILANENVYEAETGQKIKLSEWVELGPLNPQPGSVEGKPKRRKFQGEARRGRATISIRVPKDDQEDGGAVWDELLEQAQEKLQGDLGVDYVPTPYITIIGVLHSYLTS